MGLLDELKKLTKPYDDEDYLEEDLSDPVRVPGRGPLGQSYASYAEPPRQEETTHRRPYVFGQRGQAQPQYNPQGYQQDYRQGYQQPDGYAQPGQDGYAQPGQDGYAQPDYRQPQQGFARQGGYAQPGYQQNPFDRQSYPQQGYGRGRNPYPAANRGGQQKLLLVKPERFEQAADIADRIAERNAIVLNLETTPRDTTRRLLDFLSGVTYAVNGKIKKVAGNTFIITPTGMDFSGDTPEEVQSNGNYF